jgi:hypothetical protein
MGRNSSIMVAPFAFFPEYGKCTLVPGSLKSSPVVSVTRTIVGFGGKEKENDKNIDIFSVTVSSRPVSSSLPG